MYFLAGLEVQSGSYVTFLGGFCNSFAVDGEQISSLATTRSIESGGSNETADKDESLSDLARVRSNPTHGRHGSYSEIGIISFFIQW